MATDAQSPVNPVPCIIDCDPGVDDVIAILLALASPELLVLAIAPTHGNTTLHNAHRNLTKLFHALEQHLDENPHDVANWPGVDLERRRALGAGPIQVCLGSSKPFDGTPITAAYFHGIDGLADVETRHPTLSPPSAHSPFFQFVDRPAASVLSTLVNDRPSRTVAYVAVGPLTTLAHMHTASPGILSRLSGIYVMGGAISAPGNTLPTAEFNFAADPYGAKVVLGGADEDPSHAKLDNVYLFPLDLTTTLTLPFDLYKRHVDPTFKGSHAPSTRDRPDVDGHKTPLVHFTSAFLERTMEVMARYGGDAMELHDPSCVWALIDLARAAAASTSTSSARKGDLLAPGWEWTWVDFQVETTGTLTRGMCVVDRRRAADERQRDDIVNGGLKQEKNKTNEQDSESHRALDYQRVEAIEAHKHDRDHDHQDKGGASTYSTRSGARVVTVSPGETVLQDLLLNRIWNVRR